MIPSYRHDATRDSGVARKQNAQRGCRPYRRLHARDVRRFLILRIGRGSLDVPTQSEIQREAWMDAEVILDKYGGVPGVGETEAGGVLGK